MDKDKLLEELDNLYKNVCRSADNDLVHTDVVYDQIEKLTTKINKNNA